MPLTRRGSDRRIWPADWLLLTGEGPPLPQAGLSEPSHQADRALSRRRAPPIFLGRMVADQLKKRHGRHCDRRETGPGGRYHARRGFRWRRPIPTATRC